MTFTWLQTIFHLFHGKPQTMATLLFTFTAMLLVVRDIHAAGDEKELLGESKTRSSVNKAITGIKKRSLIELNDMVEAVTHRKGTDFVGYGNWCGPGGEGPPVDHIDRCCRYHDLCYDRMLAHGLCPNGENGVLYKTSYEWETDNKNKGELSVKCGSNSGTCEESVCRCDTYLANCLARNVDTFAEKHQHPVDIEKLLQQTAS